MNGVFVDTGGWMACADRSDPVHTACTAARDATLEAGRILITMTSDRTWPSQPGEASVEAHVNRPICETTSGLRRFWMRDRYERRANVDDLLESFREARSFLSNRTHARHVEWVESFAISI